MEGIVRTSRCRECGTERDTRFLESGGLQCEACEKILPCCPDPNCRTFSVVYVPDNEPGTHVKGTNLKRMQCTVCRQEFDAPKPLKRLLETDAVDFLTELGERLSEDPLFGGELIPRGRKRRVPGLQSYRAVYRATEVTKWDYVNFEVRRFVVLRRVLRWKTQIKSRRQDLLGIRMFEELLADNHHFHHATPTLLRERAGVLRNVLKTLCGLRRERKGKGIYTITEVAEKLGVHRSTVHRKIKDGTIGVNQDGKITSGLLDDYLERR